MTRPEHVVVTALHRINALPYGLARTQAAEQEVRTVEAEGPPQTLAYALSTLVDSMFWSGEAEAAFAPFTRLVRWWDAHPEYFDDVDRHHVFWMFKWMVADLTKFPTVPAEQIEATIADMERRYAVEGLGMNAVMHQRFIWANERGADDVDAAFLAWCTTPRDEFSQCEACDPGDRVAYLVSCGRVAEAVELGEATLATSPSCGSEPADLLSHLQLAYLEVDRPGDAAAMHRRAIAHLPTSKGTMAGARGRLVEFLGRTCNADQAIRRIEADAALLTGCDSPRERLSYLLDVGTATHLLRGTDGDRPVRLPDVPVTTLAALDDWLRAGATKLAAQFDHRNGTDAWARRLDRAWSARAYGPVDLSVRLAAGASHVQGTASSGAGGAAAQGSATPDHLDVPAAGRSDDAGPAAGADVAQDVEHLVGEAEGALRLGELETAAHAFAAASDAAERVGRTADAGWALAEAARCVNELGDHAGAAAAYDRALALLEAADVPPERTVPVVLTAARSYAELGTPGPAFAIVERQGALLDASLAVADEEDEAVAPVLAERRRAARQRARAELVDITARLHATAGEHTVAAQEAGTAAETFATLGLAGDAAHAFWLAGRMYRALGDLAAAAWHLESAVEGFGLAGDAEHRAEAAGELIEALRAAGRTEEADAVRP